MSKKDVLKMFFAAVALAGLMACAPPAEKKVWNIEWPIPPEEPKIKFVEMLQSSRDVEGASGLGKAIFGEDVEDALTKPYGVAVDAEGRVYVTDVGRVMVFDKKNRKVDFIGMEPGVGRLRTPIGIAVSRDGKLYVTDTVSDRVFVYTTKGKFISAFGKKGEFQAPSGLAIDEKRERFYVADAKKHSVRAYGFDGHLLLTIGERGNKTGQFNFPTNIALDRGGNLYVVDTGNFRVQVFDPEGKYMRTIGQLGDNPGSFSRPKGIAIDSEDHVYVVDAAFQNVQIFDKDGQTLLFVGEGGSDPGQFSVPAGICIDDEDRVYVVDQLNERVQVLQYLGEKWKKRQQLSSGSGEKK